MGLALLPLLAASFLPITLGQIKASLHKLKTFAPLMSRFIRQRKNIGR
jgi:hypothetical protein